MKAYEWHVQGLSRGVLSITRVGNSGVEEGRGSNSGEEKDS